MQPEIIQKNHLLLAGVGFYGDPFTSSAEWTEENEIGRLWNRLFAWLDKNRENPGLEIPGEMLEVHIEHPDTAEKGFYEIFVGFEIKDPSLVHHQLLLKSLPACTYAQFTLSGLEITGDWSASVYRDWLPQSKYERAHAFGLQVYDKRFKGMDRLQESAIDLLVPIQLKRHD